MRIAIVDDIKEERDKLADVLTKQLSRRGIHVNLFEFENGEDFLIAAKERPFTVVFLFPVSNCRAKQLLTEIGRAHV